MAKSKMLPSVDRFIRNDRKWRHEYEKLRKIILDCGLTEELKWGVPCYTFQDSNIVLIHGFKEYCAILFVKGALLKDPRHVLIQQTKNVQAARQIRFTNVLQVVRLERVLKAYIKEAVRVEKAGLKVYHKKTIEYPIAKEFQVKLDADPALRTAFYALTPGRQRAYLLYFSSAKLSKTREERVEKSIGPIMDGMGLLDG